MRRWGATFTIAAGDARIIDAAGKYVYPGLVNTHHHFFQAFVRNLMTIDRPGLTLMQWLDDIYKVFVRIDGDVIFYASAACMADLIKHGCTCSVDHQYCYTPATGKQGGLQEGVLGAVDGLAGGQHDLPHGERLRVGGGTGRWRPPV